MATRTVAARKASRTRSTEQTKAAFEELARKNRNKPVVSSKEQEARTWPSNGTITAKRRAPSRRTRKHRNAMVPRQVREKTHMRERRVSKEAN